MQKTHLYKRCLRVFALLLVLMLPVVSLAESLMVVKGGTLNLRKEPSQSSQVLAQYPTGTWMTVLEQDGDWSKVKVEGKEGYVMSKYLSSTSSDSTLYVRTNTGANLNLRDQPSLTGNVLGSYKPGTAVNVVLRGNGWYQVKLGEQLGYMASRYLSSSSQGGGSGSGGDGGTTEFPNQGFVNNPGANQVLLLREAPSTNARVLGYFKNGSEMTLHGASGSFYKVTIGGMNGYMMKKYVKVEGSGSGEGGGSNILPAAPFQAKLVNPNGTGIVNFRKAPGLGSSIIKAYPVGTEITVTATSDVWCKAEIEGVEGYVSRYFFKVVK